MGDSGNYSEWLSQAAISTTPNATDSGSTLADFYSAFRRPAGIITLIIALAGIICHLLNIIVLLHPKMRNSVNLLLTMSAVCQLLLLLAYVPYVVIFNIGFPADHIEFHTPHQHYSRYMLFFADSSLIFHMSSAWLIITTACFRFIYVKLPLKSAELCSYKRAVVAGIATIVGCIIANIPNMIVNTESMRDCNYSDHGEICNNAEVIFTVEISSSAHPNLVSFNLWIFAIFGKVLPSILLLIFTYFLVKVLTEAHYRKQRLHKDSISHGDTDQKNEHLQTTRMLLAVVITFLCVELPHGLLVGYTVISNEWETYSYLIDVIDLVTITGFSINLILYSTMSRQYRNLFINMICKKIDICSSVRDVVAGKYSKYSKTSMSYATQLTVNNASTVDSCALSMTMESHIVSTDNLSEERTTLMTEG